MKLPDLLTTISERDGALRVATHSIGADPPVLKAPAIVVRHASSEAPAQALRRLSTLSEINLEDRRIREPRARGHRRQSVMPRGKAVREVTNVLGNRAPRACNVVIFDIKSGLPSELPATFAMLRAADDFDQLLARVRIELKRVLPDAAPHSQKDQRPTARENEVAPAARLRRHILETWPLLNALEVHRHVATSGSEPNPTTAHRLRTSGRIFGLKVGAGFQYPAFQFDNRTGQPRPEMSELLKLLPKDASGWRTAIWMEQPDRRLAPATAAIDFDAEHAVEALSASVKALSPAQVFEREPARVVAFAREEFGDG